MSKKPLVARAMLLVLAAMLLFSGSALAVNSVRVACPVSLPVISGDSIGIPIHMTNDVALGGLTLGFYYNSNDVEITSVNSTNTIGAMTAFYNFKFVPADNEVLVGWIDFTGVMPIPAQTDGLAFTLWMQVPAGTSPQCVNIDSAFVAPAGPFIFSPKAGGKISPDYVDCGTEDIKLGLDVCPGLNNPPVAQCQSVTVNADAGCQAAASIDNGSYDPDNVPPGTDPITLVQVPAGPYPLGQTVVKLIVTDSHGAADTCEATVTVQDVTKPTITCPANITKNNDAGQCGAIATFSATAADNCPGVSVSYSHASGSFLFPVGVTTVWAKATDGAGNKDSCSFTVTVNDTQKPVVTCPANITKGNDAGQCSAVVTYTATATDNCPGVTVTVNPPSGSVFPIGVATVWGIATDAAGNKDSCSFTVTVNDTQKPTITCPRDTSVIVAQGETGANVDFTVTAADNCPGVGVVSTPPSGSFFLLGETIVKSIATDAAGNKDSCTFKINVTTELNPDFAIDATPDTIFITEGVPDSIVYFIDLASIDGYSGTVNLSADGVPSGAIMAFGLSPISVPNTTTFGGHTEATIPAGTYEITITATEAVAKAGPHSTKVYLAVEACAELPIIAVSEDTFNLTVDEGLNHANETVYITNEAICGTLNWAAASDQAWVTPDPLTGSVEAGQLPGSLLTLTFNTASLTPDTYVANVMISSVTPKLKQENSVQAVITIIMTVVGIPVSYDSVIVENAAVEAGDVVSVPVVFKNDEALAGMSAGLHWSPDYLTADSVTYYDSRVEYIGAKFATINNTNNTLALGVLRIPPEDLVAPGRGLWATIWFTSDGMAPCPSEVVIDSQFISPGVEVLFNDEMAHSIYPAFTRGTVSITCPVEDCISGTVVDPHQNPIAGATVELYCGMPPEGETPLATTTTDEYGAYTVCMPTGILCHPSLSHSVRAFKPGYYANVVPSDMPANDVTIVLQPNGGSVTPTWEWVNLYCEGEAYFDDVPVKVGSVIEAYDPDGVLCGQWVVTDPGTYGFMPVYRDDPYTPAIDEGCDPSDMITVKVDGYVVDIDGGPLYWGENGDRYIACFHGHTPPSEQCIVLKQGWNLISWNLDTPSDSIQVIAQNVMDNVDVILGFEAGAQTYDPLLPGFSTLLYADHFHGFWFRMLAEDTLCVNGPLVPAVTPINLEQNWNLVSYLPTVPYDVPTALASIWEKVIVVLGYENGALTYDPANPGLSTLQEMKTFFGYWIKTTQACDLIYPSPSPSFAHTPADNISTKSSFVPRVAISNTWVSLYGSGVKLNGETLPVGAAIEAYNSSGTLVGEYTVRTAGKFGFMPVYGADNLSGDAVGKSAGSEITLKVNGEVVDQKITWTENGDRILISELTTAGKGAPLPNSFTLNQNYPNPFNPETTIDYVIGKAGMVEIGVYNVLGNKIKTLVSGYQAEGSYTVKWYGDTDAGSQAASGVYLYKLKSGDFTDIKKMTLLK